MIPASNLFSVYQEAKALVEEGDLKQAADICRQILDNHPNFPYGYHLMSSLFCATGTYSNALTFALLAISKDPSVPLFHIQQGQILFSIGENEAAAEAFQNAHKLEPASPYPLLLWADTQAQQAKFEDAKKLFAQARSAGDLPEIDLHEGLCLVMQGQFEKAEKLFDRVIARAPENEWGYIQKGKLYSEKRKLVEAEACFAKALKINPKVYEALHGMALVCEAQAQNELAIRYAMQAIQANPKAWESHMHLGSMLMAHQQYNAAEQILKQAYALKPDNLYILQPLMVALRQQKKDKEAQDVLDHALKVAPDNPVLHFFKAMFAGESVATAPKDYISSLFDNYADRFDHHLQQVLAYKVPDMVARAVKSQTKATNLKLLDLGCGTGLAAEALKDITSRRVGVDLSPKMIAKARTRELYDALYVNDIVDCMLTCGEVFDLVVAADVFVYVGDLQPSLQAARGVLSNDGLLVFSIEKEDVSSGYVLKTTGRYTHSPQYIQKLATEEGYAIVQQQEITLRNEHQTPVPGISYVLKKTKAH
jgi:predicted TPR repeat methyltransferase/TolA-binding protein